MLACLELAEREIFVESLMATNYTGLIMLH